MSTPTIIRPGRYEQRQFSDLLRMPRQCGCPKRDVTYGHSPICTSPAIWWQPDPVTGQGVWTCGRHRPDKTMPPVPRWDIPRDQMVYLPWDPTAPVERRPAPPPRVVYNTTYHISRVVPYSYSNQPQPPPHPRPPPPPPTWPDDKPFSPFDCSICFDTCTSKTEAYQSPCGHLYHLDCMSSWARSGRSALTCPICRAGIPRGGYFSRFSVFG
jgi:hypothetical protein